MSITGLESVEQLEEAFVFDDYRMAYIKQSRPYTTVMGWGYGTYKTVMAVEYGI